MRQIQGFFLAFLAVFASVCAAQQQAPVKPIATVLQLHEAMISPASDALFNVGAHTPADDKQWTSVRNNAIVLAESANLLMIGTRARDNGEWMTMSRAMIDAAEVALAAATKKDADGVIEAGDQIVMSCMTCHQRYRDAGRPMGRQPVQ